MKSLRKMAGCVALVAALVVLGGAKPKEKTEVLDHKGASFGIEEPAWVLAYVSDGNRGVELLENYKKEHCFVVYTMDKSKDFALGYVNNANGPAMVAEMVSTTVLADAKAVVAGRKGEGTDAAFEAAAHAMSEASFTGLRKMADWWRIVRNKKTKETYCHAYALYTTNKEAFDRQVAGNLQNIIDNNKELSAAARSIYIDLIRDIRANGFNNR